MSSFPRRVLAPVLAAVMLAVLFAGTGAADDPGTTPDGHDHGTVLVAGQSDGEAREKAGDGAAVPAPAGGLEILGDTCAGNSDLPLHDGFQSAEPRCVDTEFGEHPAQADAPSLLIVDAPAVVRSGQPFQIKVSTRNLVRDRFLAAGAGGYYLESGFLDEQGLVRGHFHTACRLIGSGREAPAPQREPVFVATEDGGGGKAPDTVTVRLPGIQGRGLAQCLVWAGDGSHRMPMASHANIPIAADARRLVVVGGTR